MAQGQFASVLRHIRQLIGSRSAEEADGQLLHRFVHDRDEAAFAALVERHGPMVLGLCRRMLADVHEAEDVFQATFLVLVRKAGALRQWGSLGNWLWTVAHNLALKTRSKGARRRAQETEVVDMPQVEADGAWAELRPVLDAELGRLPEKYRAPVVLCYLEGKTNEEAARALGWPIGTVKIRLSRARDLLRERLVRRGLTLSAGLLLAPSLAEPASAALAPTLVQDTIKAAALFAVGNATAAGAVSARAALMAEGVLQTMFLSKFKMVAAALLAVALVASGARALVRGLPANPPEQNSAGPSVELVKPANKISDCGNNLKQIGIGLHKYHDENGKFPTGSWKPGLSWRVAVLPYLGHNDLYKEFKLDEPWDGPNNKKLLAKMPNVYRNPRFQKKDDEPTDTYFRGFIGPNTVFDAGWGGNQLPLILNANGTANTLLVVEAGEPVPWTKPAELPYDPQKLPRLGGPTRDDFFLGLFCDGHVQRVPMKTDEQVKVIHYMIQWTNTTPFELPKD